MAQRLSQKMVEDDFYDECITMGVPCSTENNGKTGYFKIQYSYGGMQLQFKFMCGGSAGISSGFVGAREMSTWLKNFNPKTAYKVYRKEDIERCKNQKKA